MNRIDYFTHNWLVMKINNDSFMDVLSLIKGRVVDLGCGTAPYKKDILMVAEEYIGVDWRNSAHEQGNVDILANLCETFPFEDNSADTVVSFQVLEHIPEPYFFLTECRRILKPGGSMVLTVPFMWHVHEGPRDFFRYTAYGLQYLIEKAGFELTKVEAVTGFWVTSGQELAYYIQKFNRFCVLRPLVSIMSFLIQSLSLLAEKTDSDKKYTAGYIAVAKR